MLPDITLAPKPLHLGPFAAVYRGWDRGHRCDVIVKVQRATGDPVAAERFRREAAVMKRLRHPNIVALYQFHEGDPAALVLEYVPGRTLGALVEAEGWLSPQRAARVIEEIAAALDCAHAQGVIHRDVKPSNILLPQRGPARLYDFGVAHIGEDTPLTMMGDILGTIEYASPEQVHGNETPDARSDVYSLAAVAYFALAKTPPFRASDNSTQAQLSVMHRQVFADPPPLRLYREDLSPEIEAAVLRGLAKAPASRYLSAGQFAAALRAAVEAGAGVPEQPAISAASRRTGALAGALAAATLLLLGVISLWKTEPFPARVTSLASPQPLLPKAAPAAPVASRPVTVVQAPTPKSTAPPKPMPKAVAATRQSPPPVQTARRPVPAHAAPTRRLIAAVVPAARPKPLARPKPPRAWLYVYAKQSLVPLGAKKRLTGIRAQSVWVDGYRASDLAGGRWTTLPTGRHVVSFVPDPRSGFAPRRDVVVMLTPGAHVRKQILLPAVLGPGAPLAAALPSVHLPSSVRSLSVRSLSVRSLSVRSLTPAASVPRPFGWYTVSGWVPVSTPGYRSPLVRASAQWVKVDGRPVLALALGHWAQLPAGKHVVTFQPTPALGIGPKTWNIDLTSQAHLSQQIPFPAPVPTIRLASQPVGRLSVSGWLPVALPGQKPELMPIPAEWITIDGHASSDLAHGLWVSLPAGRHVLVFQPLPGSGANPVTRVISLSPQARLNQLLPLTAAPLPSTPLHLRNP